MHTSFSEEEFRIPDTRTINQVAKDAELDAAYQRIAELTAELVECRDYYDKRADADCDWDGFFPNEEMRRLTSIDECLHGKDF
jgi:hypothetical protein